MNQKLITLIEKCILERRIITILDNIGQELQNVVPVYCDKTTVYSVRPLSRTYLNFNSIESVVVHDTYPLNERLVDRRNGNNLSIKFNIDETGYEGRILDASFRGIGIEILNNPPHEIKAGLTIPIRFASEQLCGFVAYFNPSLSRLGVQLPFLTGERFISRLDFLQISKP